MTLLQAHPLAGPDELVFLPLGGCGEIGMNLNLYGHDGRWLMIDLGITFGDDATPPGVDVIMPDPRFIEDYADALDGLVLTHAHEDHIGAVPYLWPRLRCPIYATPFTANLTRRKLAEVGLADEAPITEIPMRGAFQVGPFELELVTLTHSIPEPNAVVIRTPLGSVVHTGDWKFDPDPLIGDVADQQRLAEIGEEGVLAMVCDSTNIFLDGAAGSEAEVRDSLSDIIARCENRVAVACFASNVARLETIAKAAAAHGREVTLVGRSLARMAAAARESGYLKDAPPFLGEAEFRKLPRDRALMICTGSQGEPRAALTRIAAEQHQSVSLDAGDTVIFSSRIIPGNERRIGQLHNNLVRLGVEVISERNHFVHVSGHPGRDEVAAMYRLVRPRIAVPVHGEPRHLAEHAQFARSCQVAESLVMGNGAMARLAPGPAQIIDEVFAGRLAVDGARLAPLNHAALRERTRVAHNGGAVATVVLNADGELLSDPAVSLLGLIDAETEGEILNQVCDQVAHGVERLSDRAVMDDHEVDAAVRHAVRRACHALLGKRPKTDVHVVRV